MKKIIAMVLAIMMLASLALASVSCGDKEVFIGVQSGTTGQYFVDGDEDWGFDGIEGYTAKGYSNGGLAVNDMKSKNVKYVIIDEEPAKQLVKKMEGIKVINVALTEEEYAFGVDKNQPDLLASVNTILAEMKTSGKLNEIVAAYATGDGIKPFESATIDPAKADKQLVVATNAAFPPFEYKEGNKFAGVDMEIAAYIAEKLDLELVIMDMEFDSVVTSVGKNGVDIAMAGLTVNDTRKQYVNFSESYYNAAQMLIVPDSETAFDNCKTAEEVLTALKDQLK